MRIFKGSLPNEALNSASERSIWACNTSRWALSVGDFSDTSLAPSSTGVSLRAHTVSTSASAAARTRASSGNQTMPSTTIDEGSGTSIAAAPPSTTAPPTAVTSRPRSAVTLGCDASACVHAQMGWANKVQKDHAATPTPSQVALSAAQLTISALTATRYNHEAGAYSHKAQRSNASAAVMLLSKASRRTPSSPMNSIRHNCPIMRPLRPARLGRSSVSHST